ncbi:condensation domain-containing protein [Streptomyces scabiei]|uniref:condensation domain-containing protein n=1 Tax=Streptomyces scabiei TaxID=1930 RepID=UPI0006915B39|nr:condensation domain-containing protein [Streptomyces scabiei]
MTSTTPPHARHHAEAAPDTPAPNGPHDSLPLSVGQEAMWVSWKIDPEQRTHIVPSPFHVEGELDTARLATAVAQLGRRHPMLRARIVRDPDGTRLTWAGAPDIPMAEHKTDQPLEAFVRTLWQRPFDLDSGPLARVDVVRGEDATVLLITVHHIVFDGASVLLLLADLRQAYAGIDLGGPEDPEPLAAHARRSRAYADGPEGEELRSFWRGHLGDTVPALRLPAGLDPPGYTVHRSDLDSELSAEVSTCAARLGVSRFTVLYGAYLVLLRHFSGQDDLLVSAPYHGRDTPDLKDRIGFFVNALPIRQHLDDDDTYASFLLRLRADLRVCQEHGNLPLPAIQRQAGLTGRAGRERSHQAVFAFWDASRAADVDVKAFLLDADGTSCTLRLLDMEGAADYTLTTMVREDGGATSVLWKDPQGVLGPRLTAEMAGQYLRILAEIVADPQRHLPPPADLPTGRDEAATRVPAAEPGPTAAEGPLRPAEPGADAAGGGHLDALAGIWARTLNCDPPGEDDDFFELGGHSLIANTLLEAVDRRFGVQIPLRDLFEFSRFGDFAALLTGRLPQPDLTEESAPAVFPASGFQERIWFAERLEPGTTLYNVPLCWTVDGHLDPAVLERALALLVARHEILRTRFIQDDGRLLQQIGEPWTPHVVTAAVGEGELADRVQQEAARLFDLESGQLMRAALFDLGTRHALFLCFHHLVLDGESAAPLLRELDRCYGEAAGVATGTTPTTAPQSTDPRRSPVWTELAQLWSHVLRTDGPPHADDSFFSSGGTSLLVTKLVRRINDRLGCGLSLRDLFEHQRFADLVHLVEHRLGGEPAAPERSLTEDELAAATAASGFQERIWFAERLEPDALYSISLCWEADGHLDPAVVERALALLVARHEILRTRFVEHDGRLLQLIGEPWTPDVERTDLIEGGLADWARRAARQRFDVGSGRLLRAALLDLGTRHTLFLCFHHLVLDAESVPVLLDELSACYATAAGRHTELPEPKQYRTYVREAEDGHRTSGAASLDHWAQALAGAPSALPLQLPAPAGPHGAVQVPLPPDLLEQLRDVLARRKVTWFMVVATALAVLLHRRTGSDDVTFGTLVSDRRSGDANMVGPTVNTVVLRSRYTPDDTLADLLAAMRSTVLDAVQHQRAPFEAVVERLAPPREPGRTPYIDVTLNMNVTSQSRLSLDGTELTPAPIGARWEDDLKFGLTANVHLVDGKLAAALSYRGDRLARQDAQDLAAGLAELIGRFPDTLDRPVTSLLPDLTPVREEQAAPAPAAPRQFRDTLRRAPGVSGSPADDPGLDFWARYLHEAPVHLPMPVPGKPEAHRSLAVPLDEGVLPGLRALQAEHGVSLYMVAAAALATTLYRWTGRNDIVFGTPVSTREQGDEDVLGPCLNTVVIRCRRGRADTPAAVLRQVRECVLQAFEHQRTPFERVVARLNPPRRPNRAPYVDVTLTMESPEDGAALHGHRLDRLEIAQTHDTLGKFGLAVAVTQTADRLTVTLNHRGDRVGAEDADAFARGLGQVWSAFAFAPDRSLATLDLATAAVTPADDEHAGSVVTVAGLSTAQLERRIAEVWREVLSVPDVATTDNFFDRGGNSMLLSTLHHRLRTELGADLPIRHLFQFPTVGSLAAALTGAPPASQAPTDDEFRQRARRGRRGRPGAGRGEGNGR